MKASFSLILLCFKSDFGPDMGYGMCMFICLSDYAYAGEQMLVMKKAILGKLEWYLTDNSSYAICFSRSILSKLLFHQIKRYYVYCILQTEPLSTSFEKSKHKLIAFFSVFFFLFIYLSWLCRWRIWYSF